MMNLVRESIDKAFLRLDCFFGRLRSAHQLEHRLEMMMTQFPAVFSTICREIYGSPSAQGSKMRELIAEEKGFGPACTVDAMHIILKHVYDVVEPSVMEHLPDAETLYDHRTLDTYNYLTLIYDTIKLIEEKPELLHYYDL